MLDKRYQVFISTSGDEMRPEKIILAQTLVGMGFFSWGLEQRSPVSTAFARRQIDDCDYVILLLGSQYGDMSVSGIGYMHLEYIYAVARQKNIIVFMHDDPASRPIELQEQSPELRKKFEDFRTLLKNEIEALFCYKDLKSLETLVRSSMSQILEHYPVQGWVRPQNTQTLLDQIHQLKTEVEQLQFKLGEKKADPFLNVPKIHIQDHFQFEYQAQVYSQNQVQTMVLQKELSWRRMLMVFAPTFIEPAIEDHFSKCLSRYLNATVLTDLQQQIPDVHTVARAKINSHALQTIKIQMRQNHWIVPVGRDKLHRMQWQMTERCKQLLELPHVDVDSVYQS